MTTATDKQTAILQRVRALLTLADEGSGATPEEAASAAALAARLMLKYNIDEAEARAKAHQQAEYVSERFIFADSAGVYIASQRYLATALARANFCRILTARGTGYGWIIGERHNVEVVREMYARLNVQLLNMAGRRWETEAVYHYDLRALNPGKSAGVRMGWTRAYLLGAAVTIEQRLDDERRAAQADTTPTERRNIVKIPG